MARAVIDASVIISWFLPDEKGDQYESILNRIDKVKIHVPSIFEYEIMNIMLNAIKRKRINDVTAISILDIIRQYPITVETTVNAKIFDIARMYDLTAYDASYLELAIRMNTPIITYDKSLLSAAKKFKLKTTI